MLYTIAEANRCHAKHLAMYPTPKGARHMNHIRDGDIYKVITLHGKTFEIRYGYYEEFEKEFGEPIPIYPDFLKFPSYTDNGSPFVTQMQDICQHGESRFREGFCADCQYYQHGDDMIGICTHPANQRKNE